MQKALPTKNGQGRWGGGIGDRRGRPALELGLGKGWGVLAMGVLLTSEFHQWLKSCFLQRKQGEIGGEGKGWWEAGDRARPLVTKSTF